VPDAQVGVRLVLPYEDHPAQHRVVLQRPGPEHVHAPGGDELLAGQDASSVVFPAPLRPSSPVMHGVSISKVTSVRAWWSR
jgi:hypothetical protein